MAASDLYLKRLKLVQFKNYKDQLFEFQGSITALLGLNGMGKTNVLDAIYYLGLGKSRTSGSDKDVIQQNEDFFRVEGQFHTADGPETIVAKYQLPRTKTLERNKVPYKRIMEHVGNFPMVMIVPEDTALATEGSEGRRRLLDQTLSQLDQEYLKVLLQYNALLRQRNAALKAMAKEGRMDDTLLDVLDQQMGDCAPFLFERRSGFIRNFEPVFRQYYQKICGGREEVSCRYRSQLEEQDMVQLLKDRREKDKILQRTSGGLHRDDLVFEMGGQALKRFASQGQLKSFVLAVRLAQYQYLREEKGVKPILLLDDVFDKLDSQRVEHLLKLISTADFGQVFLTDTHTDRLPLLVKNLNLDHSLFYIENGQAKTMKE